MANRLKVCKYGGTSVSSPEQICKIAENILEAHSAGEKLVIVVSAMGHTTDEFIQLSQKVKGPLGFNPSSREMDMLLTAGERISMSLLGLALESRGIPAISFTGSQSGILTRGFHGRSRIDRILGDRIRRSLEEGKVVIVAGFQGVSSTKDVTTLGRGGSDTTAVALAASLDADLCEIYTDVDGIYSADPRMLPKAQVWDQVPLDLILELAHRGAGVLHPRSLEIARDFKVPLWVRSSFDPLKGTEVTLGSMDELSLERHRITGLSLCPEWIGLRFLGLKKTASFFQSLQEQGFEILSLQANLSGDWSCFVPNEQADHLERFLFSYSQSGNLDSFVFEKQWVPLSLVGTRFMEPGWGLSNIVEVLEKSKIEFSSFSISALAMTIGIHSNQAQLALEVLHDTFFETAKEVSA